MTAAVADAPVTETKPAEAPVDLSKFNDAVSDAISEGVATVKDEDLRNVRKAYGELEPRRGKSAARGKLDDDIDDAIKSGQIIPAQALLAIKDAIAKNGGLKSGAGRTSTKNPTDAHVERVLAIQIGYSLSYTTVPEGVDTDWETKLKNTLTPELEKDAATYRKWVEDGQEGAEPTVAEVAKQGARISLGRTPKGQGRKPKADDDAVATTPAAAPAAVDPSQTTAPEVSAPAAAGNVEAPAGWEV